MIAKNRAASFEYFIEDKYEAGIVLEGNEVKSLRLGNVNLNDSFCLVKNGQVTLENAHIALYEKSSAFSVKIPVGRESCSYTKKKLHALQEK